MDDDFATLLQNVQRKHREMEIQRSKEFLEKREVENRLELCEAQLIYYRTLSSDLSQRVAMLQECLQKERVRPSEEKVGENETRSSLKEICNKLPRRRQPVRTAKHILKQYCDQYYGKTNSSRSNDDSQETPNEESASCDSRDENGFLPQDDILQQLTDPQNRSVGGTLVEVGSKVAHLDGVRSLVYVPPSKGELKSGMLISASEDAMIKVWTPSSKGNLGEQPKCSLRGHQGAIFTTVYLPQSEVLFSAGVDRQICAWELPPEEYNMFETDPAAGLRLCSKEDAHKDVIWSLCAHANERVLLSCGADRTLRFWDIEKSQEDNYCIRPQAKFRTLAKPCAVSWMTENAFLLGSRSYQTEKTDEALDGGLIVVDAETGKQTNQFTAEDVTCVRAHSDIPLIVAAVNTGAAGFSRAGRRVMEFPFDDMATCVNFNATFKMAFGVRDGTLHLYDIRFPNAAVSQTRLRKANPKYNETLHAVAFADCSTLFAASADGRISTIDLGCGL